MVIANKLPVSECGEAGRADGFEHSIFTFPDAVCACVVPG